MRRAEGPTQEVGLSSPIRAQRPRRKTPQPTIEVEVEEIAYEPTLPPQLIRTIIHHGDAEFEVLEEGEADAEARRLGTDLSAMTLRIQVTMRVWPATIVKRVITLLNLYFGRTS